MSSKRKKYGEYKPNKLYTYGNLVLTGEQMMLLDKEAKSEGRNIRTEIWLLVTKHCEMLKEKYTV